MSSVDMQPSYEAYQPVDAGLVEFDRRLLFPTVLPAKRSWYTGAGKRVLDVALSVGALLVLSPVLVALALLVRAKLGPG
ncbi:MAG: hypothetical protein OER95_02745, partial [Acidimicrobiia bacterium]|nr:hypothetical protein [Acidimicrobiia bacterium]